MSIEWDSAKSEANKAKHGLAFEDFAGFDAEPMVLIDDRRDYGETRFRAFDLIDEAGYCVVYTLRGETMRLISFRRAHDKEMRRYDP